MKKENLFEQFPPVATEQWIKKISEDLKGADFNKKMVWKTTEGFEVLPFYRRQDTEKLPFINTLPGEFPYLRGTKTKNNSWLIRQNIEADDCKAANRKALDILMKGVDSLGFIINDPASVNKENFDLLLEGIHLPGVELNIHSNGKALEILEILTAITKRRNIQANDLRGAIEADPIGRLVANGTLCIPVEEGFSYLSDLTKAAVKFPNLRTIHLNAAYLGNSGADAVQELTYALAAGSEYMSQLTSRGISTDEAASKIRFSFGTGPDYFMEIARLRAARLLWSLIVKGFVPKGYEEIKMEIHCVTNRWNKTVYDPYVNMLRTQTEAMSAILGGADSVTVEPYDIAFRKPDEFSERIARNQQLILKEEAYFDKVADPAAGSYYIEKLTSLIAENTWKSFVRISEAGGLIESLKAGTFQKEIYESALKRKRNISLRKLILLGTNQYPNQGEKAAEYVDPEIAFSKNKAGNDLLIDPVNGFRAAEEFEKLRFEVEKFSKRPVVYLLPAGDQNMRKARSQFSHNFFGCAGYRVVDNSGFSTIAEGIKAAVEAKADIVVLCSSDEEYSQLAPEAFRLLKDRAILVIAGNPPYADELRSEGIEHFIHIKSDIVETLRDFNNRLGISHQTV